jgi:tripartite-type tricarboxylate transporter receptor subunit TctC
MPKLRDALRIIADCIRTPLAAATLVLALAGSEVYAQAFPERPITMIVPFAAGGAADVTGRIIGEEMSKHLGQQILVENVAGAGGATGSLRGRNAKPDGYTIGIAHMGTHAAALAVNPKLPYDPRTDFDYLGVLVTTPNIIYTRKDYPVSSLGEFIATAKAKGKDLRMSHNGVGSVSHLGCALLTQVGGFEPAFVTYRGFGPAITDMLAGKIDATCDLVASVSGHVRGGSVKALAVLSEERSPVLPDVPTAKEAGFPALQIETWTGLYAPKGVPPAILAKLRETVEKSLADPAVQKRYFDIGAMVPKRERRGGEAMHQLVIADAQRWKDVMEKVSADVRAGGEAAKEEAKK